MACDPNFADVSLLLHCDGTNGSTVFPDSSSAGNVVTANGTAAVDTATPQYGTGALLVTGNSVNTNYLSMPVTAGGPLDLTTGDFTVELSVNTASPFFASLLTASYSFGNGWELDIEPGGAGLELVARFGIGTIAANANNFPTGTWVPVMFARQGNTFGLWFNGTSQNTQVQAGTLGTSATSLWIGAGPSVNVSENVQFDEIRITKGLARVAPGTNYTPAASAFGGTCSITVPDVTGQALATAESNLVAAGLVVGSVTQTSDPVINNGFVILTAPTAGAAAMAGDTVDITESNSETVPNVNGQLLATGESNLTGAGFSVGSVTTTTDPIINDGFIIDTSPAGGTRATAGSTVDVSESISATVPVTVNTPLGNAETAITAAGLTVGSVTTSFNLTVPGGYVISTNPVGGVRTVAGTSVDIVESDGPGTGTVPNVLNVSESIAAAAIEAAGFTVGTVSFQPDAIIIAGNIDAQSPAGGTTAFLLSPVNITVSSGLPSLRVPDLFGLTESAAAVLLASLGLVVGAVGAAPSTFIPPGTVMTQNPSAGTPVAAGSIVSFVLSLGTPAVGIMFDFEATVISQYANSPTILQLAGNLNQYIDQSANFANFYNFVWNVDTAVGFGLDIWGKIVGVSRLLNIPTTVDYVGFFQNGEVTQDWQPMGSDQPPQPAVGGAMYTGHNATQTYLLDDNAYRQLILAKAFANICTTTAPAINQILQNLYGPGTAWVLNTGPMAISYNLTFTPTAIQLAILQQSGVIPTPPGVSFVINTGV